MLTTRQAQILGMFLSGMTGKQIAGQLGLSPGTIAPSLKQSAQKLEAGGIGRDRLRRAVAEKGVKLAGGPFSYTGEALMGESL